jgi:regulator of protease activity HflC (stomatin/prohibitin superfamily)
MALNIVDQYQRLIVLRWGKFAGVRQPGVRWTWPIMDQGKKVDLREQFIDVPRQTSITTDNAPIDVDFLMYYRIIEEQAEKTILEVANFRGAALGIATTTLRAVIGDLSLDDVLSKREQINATLRAKLDEVTTRWGVKVTGVEIREIEPPREVQEAMNRQLSAERVRRATITESEGERQAAINRAEGDKQAAILQAEGQREAQILEAEGHRQAQILQAEGFSQALERINQVASSADSKTMSLQYFETLKAMGQGPSTKWIFPMEFTNMLKPFLNLVGGEKDGGDSKL